MPASGFQFLLRGGYEISSSIGLALHVYWGADTSGSSVLSIGACEYYIALTRSARATRATRLCRTAHRMRCPTLCHTGRILHTSGATKTATATLHLRTRFHITIAMSTRKTTHNDGSSRDKRPNDSVTGNIITSPTICNVYRTSLRLHCTTNNKRILGFSYNGLRIQSQLQ